MELVQASMGRSGTLSKRMDQRRNAGSMSYAMDIALDRTSKQLSMKK
jgi:hypothetical protein